MSKYMVAGFLLLPMALSRRPTTCRWWVGYSGQSIALSPTYRVRLITSLAAKFDIFMAATV
jgi:hypothetical protein